MSNREGDYLMILLPILIPAPVAAPPPPTYVTNARRQPCVNLSLVYLVDPRKKKTRTSQEGAQSAPSISGLAKTWVRRPSSAALSTSRCGRTGRRAKKAESCAGRQCGSRQKHKPKNKSAGRESKLIALRRYPGGWSARGAFDREGNGDFVGGRGRGVEPTMAAMACTWDDDSRTWEHRGVDWSSERGNLCTWWPNAAEGGLGAVQTMQCVFGRERIQGTRSSNSRARQKLCVHVHTTTKACRRNNQRQWQ
ncbi:uncharacterized protein J3D65DRAFT_219465 [Phyllosticta citribraziliensis]|uniref:Uncharacterized protein n=1 Tax=Phyllosticta citribraziliensis TaxID=989973 RepID=A0ABR1M4L3_9PEZI